MNILKKPIITEKANKISELYNKYTFVVDRNVNKIQIKQAVEEKYGVSVEDVNTTNYSPKLKQKFTKTGVQKGKKASYKKAIVQVKQGDNIDFYSNL